MDPAVRLIPLGGLGEIGLNMMLVESGDDLIAVDCGLMFPDDELPGIDHVIPDFSYALAKREGFRAVFLTHGHEDHIGALPYLLREARVPVYGTPLTLALVAERLREHGLARGADLRVDAARATASRSGRSRVEADPRHALHRRRVGLAIDTPVGHHRPHRRLQARPEPARRRAARLPDASPSWASGACSCSAPTRPTSTGRATRARRREVGAALAAALRARARAASSSPPSPRTSTASSRCSPGGALRAAAWRCSGMSMEKNVAHRRRARLPPRARGRARPLEELAALPAAAPGHPLHGQPGRAQLGARADGGRRAQVRADRARRPRDPLVARHPRQRAHDRPRDQRLYRRGAEVLYEDNAFVHVSGHASQEDLKLMLNLTRPRYFVPVHGEYRHLLGHARLAAERGHRRRPRLRDRGRHGPRGHDDRGRASSGRFPAGRVLVDGKGVGDIGAVVLRDRQLLAEDGLIAVSLAVDRDGTVVAGPEIASRGFVYVKENEALLEELRRPCHARSPSATPTCRSTAR